MSKEKVLLVLERSGEELAVQKSGKDYVLEGVFTEIGVRNNNDRIYEEAEVIPHIERLQKQIAQRTLLGELDHPKSFEISMKNASHVIEDLRYDKDKKQVIGRIRLLNTSAGKEAKAFVDENVPLHISSRSAGIVESGGKVKIKQMFTYDLVATPGFSNARLAPVNEAYGFDPEGPVQLFEVDEATDRTNKVPDMDYVSREDFNRYTEVLKESHESALKALREEFGKLVSEKVAVTPSADGSEDVKALTEKCAALEQTVGNLIKHNDYIVGKLEKVTEYAELVANGVNETAGDLKSLIGYSDMLAENINRTNKYQEYVVNEVNSRFRYQTTVVNEHVDALISHSDYLSESVDSVVRYADHLREHLVSLGESVDAVVESKGTKVDDGKEETTLASEEGAAGEGGHSEPPAAGGSNENEEVGVDQMVDDILKEGVPSKEQTPGYTKEPFYRFLSKERRDELSAMDEGKRTKVLEAFKSNKYFGSVDVSRIWEAAQVERPRSLNWLADAPDKYKQIWESLSPEKQGVIKAQAHMRVLDTDYKIGVFWDTRDLRAVAHKSLNEGQSVPVVTESESTYTTDSNWMASVKEGLAKRFKK